MERMNALRKYGKFGAVWLLWMIVAGCGMAQRIEYGLDVNGFMDNREFDHSGYAIPQSMLGMRTAPEVGIAFGGKKENEAIENEDSTSGAKKWWKKVLRDPSELHHHIRVGADVLYEFGRARHLKADPRIYYVYENAPFTFYFGSFPRKDVLGDFPAVFFQDSLTYYRPNITGIYWRYRRPAWHVAAFLDWTSRQTHTEKETFIWGLSGHVDKSLFHAEGQWYMYHLAGYKDYRDEVHLHDMGVLHVAVGVNATEKTPLDTLYARAGFLMGDERRRHDPGTWERPKNLLTEVGIEYRGLGARNIFMTGEGMFVYHNTPYNEGNLYWGDPFYQAKTYDRLDVYLKMLNTGRVESRLAMALHFTGGSVYTQQVFTLTVHLGNIRKGEKPDKQYIWQQWFRKKGKDKS